MRRRALVTSIVAPVLVVAAALGAGWWASAQPSDPRPSLAAALASLPADAQVVGFTDWARIRERLDVGTAHDAEDRATLTDQAASRDLSTRSVIGRSVEEMDEAFGWSAADVGWEVFGQAGDGVAMVVRLEDTVSVGEVEDGLESLGYSADDGVWTQTGEADTQISTELAGTFRAVSIDADRGLLVAADRPVYARAVRDVIDRDAPSLLGVRAAADLAVQLEDADTALLQSDSFACPATAVSSDDAEAIAQARAAEERAGGLQRVAYAGRAVVDETATRQTVLFSLAFGSPGAAAEQVAVRERLSSGPFIGRSGTIEESLRLRSADAAGSTVTLTFDHDPDTAVVMTGTGALVFAGCGT